MNMKTVRSILCCLFFVVIIVTQADSSFSAVDVSHFSNLLQCEELSVENLIQMAQQAFGKGSQQNKQIQEIQELSPLDYDLIDAWKKKVCTEMTALQERPGKEKKEVSLVKESKDLISSSIVCEDNMNSCSCELAQLAEDSDFWTTCFSELVCPYDDEKNEFCSGHGECVWEDQMCDCDKEYGESDCSESFKRFHPYVGMMVLLLICGSFLTLTSIGLLFWVYHYRNVPEVKAMSIVFTQFTLIGFMFGGMAVITIGVEYNEVNCVLLEWWTFIGLTLILCSACVKSYRIASIFNVQSFSPSGLTDRKLLRYFGMVVGGTIFLLILYTIVNFVEGGAYYRYKDEQVMKEFRCSSRPVTLGCYVLLCLYTLALLILVLKFGNDSKIAAKVFKETKCIYVGSNVGAVAFVSWFVFITFTSNYELQIAVRGFGTFVSVSFWLGLLFAPKLRAVYQKEEEANNSMSEADRMLETRYQLKMKERTGKELFVLLSTLVQELESRKRMKMITNNMIQVHFEELNTLINELHEGLTSPVGGDSGGGFFNSASPTVDKNREVVEMPDIRN